VVKGVLEKVSLWANEDVVKEATEVFSKLNDIEYFHFCGSFSNFGRGIEHAKR
jgi:hypothetical protein